MRLEQLIFSRGVQMLFRAACAPPPAVFQGNCVFLISGTLYAGGSERQVVNTALALKRAGQLRPVVVCLYISETEGRAFYRHLLDDAGVDIVDLNRPDVAGAEEGNDEALVPLSRSHLADLPYNGDPQFMADKVARFLALFLKERPRIVHSFLDDMNVMSGIAAVLAGVPKIILSTRSVAPDNYESYQNYLRPGYRALLTKRPQVVVSSNSRAGAADYRDWLKKPNLDVRVVRNGIDFEEFAARSAVDAEARTRFGLPPKGLVVGSIMRMSGEKQPLLWAQVAIEISRRRPDVQCLLAGEGPLREQIEKLVRDARLDKRIHLLGQIADIPSLLRTLDVFLLTSLVEGLPNVLIEAQAVGVPVVTTPAGGAAETLDHGVSGLVTPDQSVRGITDTCMALLDDDNLRARMGKAASDFVRRRFSMAHMLDETMRLYEE
jgi:glycosyltransferase involved in cell wall biosynthesis